MARYEQLISLAQLLVDEWPNFFAIKGAGAGDRDTNAYMKELRTRAVRLFGRDHAERRICGDTKHSVDYHFPDESTIIEIAMGLRNPSSEYERDILKAIMAQEAGHDIRRLVFLSKPGAIALCSQPGHRAFAEWAELQRNITIEIREFTHLAEQVLEPVVDGEA
jgi:hypothetical protein